MSGPGEKPATHGASPIPDEVRRANVAHWDEWTRVHEKSAFYDVAGFKAGATSLWPLESEELGPYVGEGTTLLHLQCHFGMDTLSWARRGAVVTGVDLSEEAIALARRLADEVGLAGRATFIAADVYEADQHLGDALFDVVFVSWGALEWLPDLDRWAALVARHLRPGGLFYMAEIHPVAYALGETEGHGVRLAERYLPAPDEPDRSDYDGSYADPDVHIENRVCYSWAHGMGGDPHRPGRRRPARRVPARVPVLRGAVLRLDGARRRPLVLAARWARRAARGPAVQLLDHGARAERDPARGNGRERP